MCTRAATFGEEEGWVIFSLFHFFFSIPRGGSVGLHSAVFHRVSPSIEAVVQGRLPRSVAVVGRWLFGQAEDKRMDWRTDGPKWDRQTLAHGLTHQQAN